MGLIDNWLRYIRDVRAAHAEELSALSDLHDRSNRLVELKYRSFHSYRLGNLADLQVSLHKSTPPNEFPQFKRQWRNRDCKFMDGSMISATAVSNRWRQVQISTSNTIMLFRKAQSRTKQGNLWRSARYIILLLLLLRENDQVFFKILSYCYRFPSSHFRTRSRQSRIRSQSCNSESSRPFKNSDAPNVPDPPSET